MRKPWAPAPILLLLVSCSHAQLEAAAETVIRAERGTAVLVEGVVDYKDVVKEDCIAQNLQTEAERAACVEKALKAVKVSRASLQGVRAALVSFWEVYGLLEAKLVRKEKITGADLADLLARGARVVTEYEAMIKAIKEAKEE